MKRNLLLNYTRIQPSVLALQLLPGVEDNWIAVDANGNELSRASTIEAVQRAVPDAADYQPVLDLPGLQGKALHMGDYVIDDGDGVFWIMPKEQFEELFAEGEGEEIKVGKARPEKAEYNGEKLGIAELLQILKERDERLEQLSQQADPAGITPSTAVTEGGNPTPEQSSSPDTDGQPVAMNGETAPSDGSNGKAPDPLDATPATPEATDGAGSPENPTEGSTEATPAPIEPSQQSSTDQSSSSGSDRQKSGSSSAPNSTATGNSSETSSTENSNSSPTPAAKPKDPLDHDGDGAPGGSLPGADSTAAKGKAKKTAAKKPAKTTEK